MSKTKKNKEVKIDEYLPEVPNWVSVRAKQNTDPVLAYSSASSLGPANISEQNLTNRTAYLKQTIESLPATAEEVAAGVATDKFISPATAHAIVKGTPIGFIGYTFLEASEVANTGWYPCDGILYALDSPQGKVLNSFSVATKLRCNLEIVGNYIRIFNVLSTPAYNNGGYYLRPNEDGKQGTIQTDTIQAHQHNIHSARSTPPNLSSGFTGTYEVVNNDNISYTYAPDPDHPEAGDPRIGMETNVCNLSVLALVYLGV